MLAKRWKHQDAAYWFAYNRAETMLAMAMGTGKSRVACELLEAWKCYYILILCPVSVMQVWLRELRKWSPNINPVLLNKGTVVQQADQFNAAKDCLARPTAFIKNYEGIWRVIYRKICHVILPGSRMPDRRSRLICRERPGRLWQEDQSCLTRSGAKRSSI